MELYDQPKPAPAEAIVRGQRLRCRSQRVQPLKSPRARVAGPSRRRGRNEGVNLAPLFGRRTPRTGCWGRGFAGLTQVLALLAHSLCFAVVGLRALHPRRGPRVRARPLREQLVNTREPSEYHHKARLRAANMHRGMQEQLRPHRQVRPRPLRRRQRLLPSPSLRGASPNRIPIGTTTLFRPVAKPPFRCRPASEG